MKQALFPEVRVVHSSRGRLRVHLPDPQGQAASRLRELPGVLSAETNRFTGNVLILFNVRQTSELAILGALRDWCESVPAPSPSVAPIRRERLPGKLLEGGNEDGQHREASPSGLVGYVRGFRAWVYQALGWGSVGLAVVGAVTPGIPTVPFVILAGYFFVRSSPRAHQWLRRSRWFGAILTDWETHRGVRRSVKFIVVGIFALSLVLAVVFELSAVAMASLLSFGLLGVILVLRLPEVTIHRGVSDSSGTPALPALAFQANGSARLRRDKTPF